MKTSYNHTQLRLFLNVITITVLVLLLTQGCTQTVLDSNEAQQLRQFVKWKHTGTIYIITTPEGAYLPAPALEQNFPLLVRLHKDFFDFSQAKPSGEDIRFASNDGMPLPYQIEEWDAVAGSASIWVKIPSIRGNARQAIKMYWGNNDASSESDGQKVFSIDAGFAGVWHLGDNLEDSTPNNLNGSNNGSTNAPGIIGDGQVFGQEKGITISQPGSKDDRKVACLPAGNQDRSMSAWIKSTSYENNWGTPAIGGWGGASGGDQSFKLSYMRMSSRGQIQFHGYWMDPKGVTSIPLHKWRHVALTISGGKIRFYLDGREDHVTKIKTMKTVSPTVCNVGRHISGGQFQGDLDEVRFEAVARSADWMKLCYENQKPMQTLTGPLVASGNDFSVSQSAITVKEGKRVAVTGTAGGAQKTYWILKDGDEEKIIAVDRFNLSFDAGRVRADKKVVLQFRAVYEKDTKTKDIAITIQEDIPEPVFTLSPPANWNGRDVLEISPVISNLAEMKAKGAGKLNYAWNVSGMATITKIEPDRLILKRSQNSGKLTISLALDNGDIVTTQTATMMVTEPKKDAWVQRIPAKDEKPIDNQFYARNDDNVGTLYYNGTLDSAADSVFLKVYAGDKLYDTQKQLVSADKTYALSAKLNAGLVKYRIEFGTKKGNSEKVLDTAKNLVCGDAYIIQGQSNAEAWADQVVHPYRSDWLRSFGTPITHPGFARERIWGNALSFNGGENRHKLQVGYWGVELAKQLIEQHKVPICIINGAQGGTRVAQHQRNPEDPEDVKTIYGRLLWRVRQARLTHGIRGIIWHQGEADGVSDGPGPEWGWETYQHDFLNLAAAWKEDYPNIQHYYIFQIWPKACAAGVNGSDDKLREVQRQLPRQFSNMGIMSTLGIRPEGGCHYPPEGYAVMAHLIYPLVARDNYGKVYNRPVTPPNLVSARYVGEAKDEIALEFDQKMRDAKGVEDQIYMDGIAGKVISARTNKELVILELSEPSDAQQITYVKGDFWNIEKTLLKGENGIAALTFCEVPILPAKTLSMFFPSPYGSNHMWDTWLYYNDGTYYLFWLDGAPGTSPTPWNSHVLATSKEGVYYKPFGRIYNRAKDDIQGVGTGHTWKSPDFEKTGKFINNYSEHRISTNAQEIHFAESTDLVHWKKVDEKYRFKQDTRWYKEKGRWDCIDTLPRPSGGLYGFWTASPDQEKTPGARVGFGESKDGLTWTALKPPVLKYNGGVELGGIHKVGDTYYMMISGGTVLQSKSVHSPFVPQTKNTSLIGGNMYFPRFFHNHPDGLMVNYHMIGPTGWMSARILFAPLKRAVVDSEGIMRAMWWKGNDTLKREELKVEPGTQRNGSVTMLKSQFPAEKGVILEGRVQPAASDDDEPRGIYFDTDKEQKFALFFFKDRTELCTISSTGTGAETYDSKSRYANGVVRRGVTFGPNSTFRLLLKPDVIEVYCNDHLMQARRFPPKNTWNGRVGLIGSVGSTAVEIQKAFTPGEMPQ